MILEKTNVDIKTIEHMYFELKLSTKIIGEKFGVSRSTIGRCLLAHGNVLRIGNKTTNHTQLSEIENQIIDGLLLGDASIARYGATPFFRLNNITKTWIEDIKAKLPFDFKESEIPPGEKIILGKLCNIKRQYTIVTGCDLSLVSFYNRWHPNNVKKTIPSDLVLTPIVVKHWFYGAGGCFKVSNKYCTLDFATNGFTFEDVELLQLKFAEVGFKLEIQENLGKPILRTGKASTVNALFDYMGPCDVEGFEYKWKRPTGIKSQLENEQVIEIREQYATGLFTQQELADKFDVSRENISQVTLRKTFKHI